MALLQPIREKDYLTEADIINAIGQLTDADHAKLKMIARKLSGGIVNEDDLLQNAFLAALGGYEDQKEIGLRRCPHKVDFVAFLAGAMKSIASNARSKGFSYGNAAVHASEDTNIDEFLSHASSSNPPSQEQRLVWKETAQAAFGLFDDDEEAGLLLIGIADGMSASEVCAEMQIDKTRFDTVRKRIRRKIKQHYPKGLIS